MIKFFEPQGKVQKNREIIRETDTRMAKYSRRGLITNFLIFLLCIVYGEFIQFQSNLAIILTIGLLLTTILRGYFLFRFESIYPHAPARWRNFYFVATLLGAVWWGLIMCSITLVLDLRHEAPLLWLYTVVFFSTTAHAFAPYERFLSYYQFIGLVPASACTFFIGDFIGVIYGTVLLFFFWILNHQCHLMADNYWTRLEANYILARKAESLEEEKRDTRASVQLSKDYMSLLKAELKSLLNARRENRREDKVNVPVDESSSATDKHPLKRPKLQLLYNNVSDFQQILAKEIILEPRIFNVRQHVQSLIALFVDDAESRGIELISVLSPAIPMRLYGDAGRLAQLLHIMLASFIEQTEQQIIFIDLEFIRSVEGGGELNINLYRQKANSKKLFFQEQAAEPIELDLGLALGFGISDAMGGAMEISDSAGMAGAQLRFTTYFDSPASCGQIDYFNPYYRGKKLLLVDTNARVLDIKRQELGMLGLEVTIESDFKRAFISLEHAMSDGRPYDFLLYHVHEKEKQAIGFSGMLNDHNELKHMPQFIVCSENAKKSRAVKFLLSLPNVHCVNKPLGAYEFDLAAHSLQSVEAAVDEQGNVEYVDSEVSLVLMNASQEHDVSEILKRFMFNIFEFQDIKNMPDEYHSGKASVAVFVVGGDLDALETVKEFREAEYSDKRTFHMPVVVVGDPGFEARAYEKGADHYLIYGSPSRHFEKSIRFWHEVSVNNR